MGGKNKIPKKLQMKETVAIQLLRYTNARILYASPTLKLRAPNFNTSLRSNHMQAVHSSEMLEKQTASSPDLPCQTVSIYH